MRILIVSNYYPPHFIGGYELGCCEVAQALKARGHQVHVLTSTYGVEGPQDERDISRRLQLTALDAKGGLSGHGRALLSAEISNQKVFARLCQKFRPDIVYFWNMSGLSISLVFAAERRNLPFCIYVSEHWFSQWDIDPWYRLVQHEPVSILRRIIWRLARAVLRAGGAIAPTGSFSLRNIQFCSEHLKKAALEKGLAVAEACVIYWGTNVATALRDNRGKSPRRLLYVGQIMPHKCVHTAVEALSLLAEGGCDDVTLTLAGGSINPEYEEMVRGLAAGKGLESRCRFTGSLPRAELLTLYADHDILVFPSCWEEPFAITPLEAMASGLAVVATATGGSGEIFEDGVNALVFPKTDSVACAGQIKRLLDDSALFELIRSHGQRTVEDRFRFDMMVDKIESSLSEAASRA